MPQTMKKEYTLSGTSDKPYDCVHWATWSSANDFEGGDYYSFYPLPGLRFGALAGDVPETKSDGTRVSGNVLVRVSGIIEDEILRELANIAKEHEFVNPGRVVGRLNDRMVADPQHSMGMCPSIFSVFEMETGIWKVTNAGLPDPIIVSGGKANFVKTNHQQVPGVDKFFYEHDSFNLDVGDWGIIGTDGVTEAGARKGEPISRDAILGWFETAYKRGYPFDQALIYVGRKAEKYAREHSDMGKDVLEDEMTLTGFAYLRRPSDDFLDTT